MLGQKLDQVLVDLHQVNDVLLGLERGRRLGSLALAAASVYVTRRFEDRLGRSSRGRPVRVHRLLGPIDLFHHFSTLRFQAFDLLDAVKQRSKVQGFLAAPEVELLIGIHILFNHLAVFSLELGLRVAIICLSPFLRFL